MKKLKTSKIFSYFTFCSLTLFILPSESLRIVRSSTNLFQFMSHALDSETTTEIPSFCMPHQEEKTNEAVTREKRSEPYNASLPNSQNSPDSLDLSKFSDAFLECQHVEIEPECYIKLSNGSIKVPLYDRVFDENNYLIRDNGELLICPEFFDDFSDDSKFSKILDIFSIVGVSISSICITLHIIMFLSLKKLRNLPGYCLFSLCKALLLAYICSFTTFGLPNRNDCTAVGMLMLYAFLASFFWMNAMSFDVWRSLRMATAKLRLVRDRPMLMRYALYCAYSWGVPLLIIVVSLIVNHLNTDYRYNLIFNINTCWFHYKPALLVYFGAPFFILLFFNILLFIHSFIMITSASMNTAENKAALWSRFLVSMRLAIVMGLTWICGIIATTSRVTAFWYIYTILNTLQGVFIFLCFSFTDKTIKECKRVVGKKKSSLFPSQTSTTRGQTSSEQHDSPI
ncbi:probable G-protein coupled receptor Mth-like 3 [Parasteatoda tepidariorum]|nr:probable G-protein coupled receptor Mth-like 3 [Parasteatoda tepidariorum]